MKVLTWSRGAGGAARPGVLQGDGVVDLGDHWPDVAALIAAGPRAWDVARARAASGATVAGLSEVRLHPPWLPAQIRDFLCFEEHLRTSLARGLRARVPGFVASALERMGVGTIPPVWYERPLWYKGNRFAVSGYDEEVPWPGDCRWLDYELELGAVIGVGGRRIPVERARDHLFGFVVFNDLTARDWQGREMGSGFHLGPSKSKDFDGANALGGWITTADEVPDPYALTMTATVDGARWSSGTSAGMRWRFEELIHFVSQDETLHPGELFGSGTVGGGCGWELGRPLQPGSVVELEISGVGRARTRIGPRG